MPKIWVGRTTRNGEKKGDGLTKILFAFFENSVMKLAKYGLFSSFRKLSLDFPRISTKHGLRSADPQQIPLTASPQIHWK